MMIHNDYGRPSGEEHAAERIGKLLTSHGHEVFWFRRSSAEIIGSFVGNIKAFCAGIHNPLAAKELALHLDKVKPDLVQVQNIYPLLSPSIFRPIKERGIPVVMRCPNYRLFCPNGMHLAHGEVCEKCLSFGWEIWCILRNCEDSLAKSTGYALRNMWARMSGSILHKVDMFIVQSAFQKQKFTERGIPESRIGIVPAVVACNRHAEPDDGGDLVTFIGRVSAEKGIEDFVDAARLMPDVRFAVAGSEDAVPGIRERSPANVAWLGFLQSDGLDELYVRSRVVVVPSRWYEGFPNVIAQAMIHARPVVAARIGALVSIVDDGYTGLHFRPSDPSDLVGKLRLLYQNPSLCQEMGRNARVKALTYYSADSVYQTLMGIYDKAFRSCSERATYGDSGIND